MIKVAAAPVQMPDTQLPGISAHAQGDNGNERPSQSIPATESPVPAATPIYPVQYSCGHIYLERYQFPKPLENGVIGFCWCGFCRTRLNVYAATPDMHDFRD